MQLKVSGKAAQDNGNGSSPVHKPVIGKSSHHLNDPSAFASERD
jgi:hypothetical protein